MAKIINRGRSVIRNAHLIGAGTPFKAVRNANKSINWRASISKQSGKSPSRSTTKIQAPAKTTPKVRVTGSRNKAAKTQTWKSRVPAPSKNRFSRFKAGAAKLTQTPKSQIKQIKRTPPKPPKKGR